MHIAHLHNSTCFPFFDSPQSTTVGAGLQLHQGTPPSNSKLLALFAGAFPSPPRRLYFIYLIYLFPQRARVSCRCSLVPSNPSKSLFLLQLPQAHPAPAQSGGTRRRHCSHRLPCPAPHACCTHEQRLGYQQRISIAMDPEFGVGTAPQKVCSQILCSRLPRPQSLSDSIAGAAAALID